MNSEKKVSALFLALVMAFGVGAPMASAAPPSTLPDETSSAQVDSGLDQSASELGESEGAPIPTVVTGLAQVSPVTVAFGTRVEDIVFPASISTLPDASEMEDVVTVESWQCDGYDADAAGTYECTAQLALREGQTLDEGVVVPVLEVTVAEGEGSQTSEPIDSGLAQTSEVADGGVVQTNGIVAAAAPTAAAPSDILSVRSHGFDVQDVSGWAVKSGGPFTTAPEVTDDGWLHYRATSASNVVDEQSPLIADGVVSYRWKTDPAGRQSSNNQYNYSFGALVRYVDESNYLHLEFTAAGFVMEWKNAGVGGYTSALAMPDLAPNTEHEMVVRFESTSVTVILDGVNYGSLSNAQAPTAAGKLGFRAHNAWTKDVYVADVAYSGLDHTGSYVRSHNTDDADALDGFANAVLVAPSAMSTNGMGRSDAAATNATQQGVSYTFIPTATEMLTDVLLRYTNLQHYGRVILSNATNGTIQVEVNGARALTDSITPTIIATTSPAFEVGVPCDIEVIVANENLWVWKDGVLIASAALTDAYALPLGDGTYGFFSKQTVDDLVYTVYDVEVEEPSPVEKETIEDSNGMTVTLNKLFPSVMDYTLASGKTMDGQVVGTDVVSIGLLNATPVNSWSNYIPRKVDFVNNGDNATYTLYIADPDGTGAADGSDDLFEITINYKVEGSTLVVETTGIEELTDAKLKSINFPGNSLLSVSDPASQSSAQLAAWWDSVGSVTDLPPTGNNINSPNAVSNYNTQYDRIFDLKAGLDITRVDLPYKTSGTAGQWQNDATGRAITPADLANEVGIAILTNGDVAATIVNNRASEKYRFAYGITKSGADILQGRFEDGRHYYRHDVSTGALEALGEDDINWQLLQDNLPLTKVYLGEDQNSDGQINWQDGALLYRHAIAAEPDSTQDNKGMTHMPVNNEYVRNSVLYINHNLNHTNSTYDRASDIAKKTYNLTDGFGQRAMFKGYQAWGHDDSHPDYGNHFGPLMGGLEGFQEMTEVGAQYNTSYGVHLSGVGAQADAFYVDPRTNDGRNGYKWVDSTPSMFFERDMLSGQMYGRLKELEKNVPGLGWVYLDVYYHADWVGRHTMETFEENDWMTVTEFGGAMSSFVSGNHWGNDIGYPDQGVNVSGLRKFIMYNNMETPEPDPLLRGSYFLQLGSWRGHDYANTVDIFNAVDLPNKYLQHFELQNYDWGNQATFASGVKSVKEGDRTIIYGVDGTKIADLPYEVDYRPSAYGSGGGRSYDMTQSAKVFIPWTEEVDFEAGLWDSTTEFKKAYAYHAAGGSQAWDVPAGWSGGVELYKLTGTGRELVDTLPIVDGKVSLDLEAKTGYVVYPTNTPVAKVPAAADWTEANLLGDTSFISQSFVGDKDGAVWNKQSTAASTDHITMTQDSGDVDYLQVAGNSPAATVWQDLEVEPGANYTASIWTQIGGNNNNSTRKVKLIVEDSQGNVLGENFLTRNVMQNYISEHQYYGAGGSTRSSMWIHPLKTTFTAPADGKVRYKLEVAESTDPNASVYFNWADMKEFFAEPGCDLNDPKVAYCEDFENMDQNWGTIEKGRSTSNQSHIAEKYVGDPVADWYVPTDDNVQGITVAVPEAGLQPFNYVIDDRFSLYLHDAETGEIGRTFPQSMRLEPNKRYKLSFDYKSYDDMLAYKDAGPLYEVAVKASLGSEKIDLLRQPLAQTPKDYTHNQHEYYTQENEPAAEHFEYIFETGAYASKDDPNKGDIYLAFNKLIAGENVNLFLDNIVIVETDEDVPEPQLPTVDPLDLCDVTPVAVRASSTYGNEVAGNVLVDDASFWSTGDQSNPHYLEFDFGREVTLDSIYLSPRPNNNGSSPTVEVQKHSSTAAGWPNGTNYGSQEGWTSVSTGAKFISPTGQELKTGFPLTTRYLRLVVTDGQNGYSAMRYFEPRGSGGTDQSCTPASIAVDDVETTRTHLPSLPSYATVTMEDGVTTRQVPVTWSPVTVGDVAKAGTFEVVGATGLPGALATVAATVTVKDVYFVYYDANGAAWPGQAADEHRDIVPGDSITLTDQVPVCGTGYDFVEWNTQSDGAGTGYESSETMTPGASGSPAAGESDITLYAICRDTVAPGAPVIVSPVDGVVTSDATPTVSGSGEPGATVSVMVDGVVVGTVPVDDEGAWSFVPTVAWGEGAHAVTVSQSDAAGNVSVVSGATDVTVDTVAPGVDRAGLEAALDAAGVAPDGVKVSVDGSDVVSA
ncbi:MAG: endo-alpha-N-acetylgalactosaminidase family protein, partial [Propionibacteriaceae bacterium]|nr:endo-alpha-N-acetylgalactosaminidase family protein [Propionibacteriaceae bacterium]